MSDDKEKVMHASFEGKGITLLASDGTGRCKQPAVIFIYALILKMLSAMENVFNALAQGGKITMPSRIRFGVQGSECLQISLESTGCSTAKSKNKNLKKYELETETE